MKHEKYFLSIFLAVCVLLTTSCSGAGASVGLVSKTVLIGSTPGDSLIKSLLNISPEKQVDFIRWDLSLNGTENGSGTFALNIVFGEGQPNTRGFKGGGERLSFAGVYAISKSPKGDVYELKSETPATVFSLVKLNENLFHLLTPDKKLMVGTGGWSYTLSRKDAPSKSSPVLAVWTTSLPVEASPSVIFIGRTPCFNFAEHLPISNECLKIKWKIILFRDSATNQPTTFVIASTVNRQSKAEGKWSIIKGIKNNPGAIVYRLDFERPDESVSFLVGDENVLFFLDGEGRLLNGDDDFSFTLNRSRQ